VSRNTAGSGRKPRTDAQRNRSRILDAAEEFFAQLGVAVSMDAIAKQAGVEPGTPYRHFPNREALLADLMAARARELEQRREGTCSWARWPSGGSRERPWPTRRPLGR
jgi:AcrR family transcriptional regulator